MFFFISLRRVTEDVLEWQSQTVIGQDSAVSEPWAYTQSVGAILQASREGSARRNTANTGR